jgi:hypothetical protein
MARVRTVEFLPEIFQTPATRQFLNATLDQLVQEPAFEKTQGFVGRKVGPGVNPIDRYVIEPTKSRNDYQLEPGVISLEPDTNNIIDAITYPGINDALQLQGAFTNNADRLYASEYYTWDPFVDFDKFVNYSQYYWLPLGPDDVDVFSTGVPLTDNFVVTRENGVYTFSGVGGENPVLNLVRGGTYTFQVAQNAKESQNFRVQNNGNTSYLIDRIANQTLTLVRGNTYTFTMDLSGLYPFYIKTQPTLGTTNQYNQGVANNGAATGTITFTVPQDAPDTLYYVNPTQFGMQGIMNVINGTPGTGPGFWIQTDPGVNGLIPVTPNISSRNVLGVSNNGEDLGTITFNVPKADAQDFFYTLAPIAPIVSKVTGTVELLTTLPFNLINGQTVADFFADNPNGIDGINDLQNRTLAFVDDVTAGTNIYFIEYVVATGGLTIQLNLVQTVGSLQKFTVLFGSQYSSTQWYKNASGSFQQIPLLTAVRDVLFYQDGTDPEIFGQIRLISETSASTIVIEDIEGKKNYTSPNGVVFTNGLKVIFRGNVIPDSYQNNSYYVEGVGTAIKLLPVTNFVTPETYTEGASVPYDSTPYDVGNYDATLNAPLVPDYLTINRASPDLNAWTRSNRWFHIDVINATAAYNNTAASPDNRLRARRPILEFRAGTKLFDFGTDSKQPVNIIDFETTDALSTINGTTGYGTDGYLLAPGSRVIFAADQDSQVRNKIYEVQFIVPDSVPPLIAQPVINLVPAPDATVLPNQTVLVLSGETEQGLSYWYDGVEWISAQQKTGVNQPPLFDIYDSTGVSFGDRAKYLSSNFRGSKLFSYATSNLSPDAVLGFPVRYLSLANVGDIVFDNNLYNDTFSYVTEGQGQTKNISEGFVRQYSDRTDFVKEIGWQTAITPSLQRQQFQFTYDGSPLSLDVKVDVNNVVPPILLYINSTYQEPNTYSYTTTDTTTTITFSTAHVPGDIIEVAVLSDQVSATAFYQIPVNLENNPLNGNSETFTLGTIRSHYQTIGENLLNIQGPIIGANNTRDLGNIIPYGLQILQQSSPMTLAGYFMRDKEYDIFAALEYNSREYIKFKSLLMETVVRNEYGNLSVSQILDSAIYEINKGRTNLNSFYWSDMLPTGAVYTQTETLITPITPVIFNTIQTYNFTSANYHGLLVYRTRPGPNNTSETLLLVRDQDYVVSTDSPRLTVTVSLIPGDTVTIREYASTTGNFVPNTPTKLGLYSKYVPRIFVDTNYVEPQVVIQGHDGSITMAFGDIRDQVLLEFEKRIYNNLKTDDNPIPLTPEDVIPGFFRQTDYSVTEVNAILNESFLTWVGWNKLDYKSQDFIATNPFTYNYSTAGNKINGAPLPGAWRGIYEYFYDTISPNLTPWEMLGLSEKPTWWENRYGPAPYTSGNKVLWDDLAGGYVADPVAPYFRDQYTRPAEFTSTDINDPNYEPPREGIWRVKYGLGPYPIMDSIIPVGSEGQLLPPLETVVGNYDATDFRKSWVAGDGGPTQASWWVSSSYPYAVMRLLILTKPAEFFSLFADRDLYRFDAELGQYLYNGRYRLTTTTKMANQPENSTLQIYGNGVSKASYIDWIVDYNQQLGRNSTTALTQALSNIDVRLCYRMASFTGKQYLKVFVERSSPNSTNSSLLLPDDSYNLLLYKNQPFSRVIYSSIVVERTDSGYSIYGYNNTQPFFNIFASSSSGRTQVVSGGGAEVRVPSQYTTTVVQVPYGYNFTNTTSVVDFILSYGAYLESQGLIFDDRENNYTLNWRQMATEFLYFSQQGWSSGTLINLNPVATTLRAYRPGAVVDSIESTSPENLILDQNRQNLPTRDLVIQRNGDEFAVLSAPNQALSFLNMKFTSYENMVVLDNVSIFQDLIYDSITGARQNRVRVTAATSTDWNGTLDAQGFILNENNVKQWQPNRKYTKGEIVLYKNNYWSAQNIVQPKVEFNYDDWLKSDYDRIQEGLLPNIANKADQLANSYNTQVANLEADNDLLSYGLIGFRPRQYMADLNLDDVSQVNLYQQFLPTKGTIRAAEIFTNANLGKESGEYNVYENWGVLVGTYGANANRRFIELRLNEADLKSNPSTVQVTTPQQSSQADQTVQLGNLWRESIKLTNTDIFPTDFFNNRDTALPSAGYVNLNDIDITVFSLDDPASLSANLDSIGIGTTIWAAKSNSYDWNVYRCNRVPGILSQVTDNLNGTSIAQFTQPHGLSVGDLVIVRYFDANIDGVYRVLSVPSISSITIAYRFNNTNQTSISGNGLAFYLQTMRVTQASDVASLPYVNSLIPGSLAYVDNDGTGHWEVLEKQNPFTEFDQLIRTPQLTNARLGSSVAQALNLSSILVGAPGVSSDAGAICIYGSNSNSTGYTSAGQLTLATPETVGYGDALAYGQNTWSAAGAPRSRNDFGYVTVLNKNNFTNTYNISQLLTKPNDLVGTDPVLFGTSVAISLDERWMYIGAPGDALGGKVYAYGRVDVQTQSVEYTGDGTTTEFNWSNHLVVDSANKNDQIVVTVGNAIATVAVDYVIGAVNVTFTAPPSPGIPIRIFRRNRETFVADGTGNTYNAGQYLYTARNYESFSVLRNTVLQRPYIDYTFDPVTRIITLISLPNPPAAGTQIDVIAGTYWKYCGSIDAAYDSIPVDGEFGISLTTSTDGRQVIIGADKANAEVVVAGSSSTIPDTGAAYVFDRSVIRYTITDITDVSYNMPGTPAAPVAVVLNNEFLTVGNVTTAAGTTTQFINGQVDIDYVAGNITLAPSVSLTVGDILEIETNEFQPLQKVISNDPAQDVRFGRALDICATNCSLYVGAPDDSSVLIQAGSVERSVNQSRQYGITTSTIANPVLTAGDTVRINNFEIAVPANNTVAGLVDAINSANLPNVIARNVSNVEFVGNGTTQSFDVGTIYSSTPYIVSPNTRVLINGVLQLSGFSWSGDYKTLNFVTAPVAGSLITVVAGRMTITVKNIAAEIDSDKLSVLPGVVGSAFDDLGFNTFVYTQTIVSPNPATYAAFGSSISVDTGAINLVVGAPNGNIYEPMPFDGGDTRFDDRSTTFFNPVINSGVAYTYDFLPSANGSVDNPGKFVFGQQIYVTGLKALDQFGVAVNYVNGQLLAGCPGYDNNTSNSNYGLVEVFANPTNQPAWTVIHRQQPVVDVSLINTAFMYDKLTSGTQTYFDFFDPLQGKILGAARRNIDYIGAVDPANYNQGNIHNQGNSWGSERVGQMWWDTDTVRFIDPNQDDIVYASRRWGQVFPGSRVDIYQWIESSVPPVSYTGPGVPLSTTSFSVRSNLNKENIFVTSYYFWVRGINTIDTSAGKTLSPVGVSRYIESPRTSGIPYIALLNPSTVAIYNGLEYISAADTILHIGYDQEFTDDNIHTEYQFVTDGIADSFLNATLYRKLQDSFCGTDTSGAVVPDPTLSPAEQYGVQFRPRQSMFANRFMALENYLTRANNVLKLYPVVETKNFGLLNSVDPEPSRLSASTIVTINNGQSTIIAGPAVITWPNETINAGTPVQFSTSASLPTGIDPGVVYYVKAKLSANTFTISATVNGPVINISGTQAGTQLGTVVQWDQRVPNIEELSYQDLDQVPLGYLYLVESDSTQNGYWTIYRVVETGPVRTLLLSRIQNYYTPDYWYHIDWYRPGYNRDIQPIAEVPVTSALSSLNLITAPVGSSVKVTANAQGKFEIYIRADATQTGWDRVGLQDGTIQFSESLWDYPAGGFGWDVEPYDSKGYGFDREPVIETRKIIQAINEQLFVDDLAMERNRSLILMFNYVYSEFASPEWLIKTSLIDVQHNIRSLQPFQTYLQDNQTFVLDYIQEVKPYHVQIRDFNLIYFGEDAYAGNMTDFDVPAYWKTIDITIPQYVSPVLQFDQNGQPYTLSDSLIENNISDTAPDAEIWTQEPWIEWYNNYLLELESIAIINGGSGYTVAPQVLVNGELETNFVAIVNSAGQVVGVDLVDNNKMYLTTPVITFLGGNGSGAMALAVLGNSLVRSIRTTIKYDRCEYVSTIVDWEPNVSYDNGTQVRHLNRVWQANSDDSAPVSGSFFNPTQWLLVDANTLSGADRTMGYYTPTANETGLSLPLLINGISYPGVQVYGVDFNFDTGYDVGNYDINPWDNIFIGPDGVPTYDPAILDAIYESDFLDPYLGVLPAPAYNGDPPNQPNAVVVNGGEFVDTYSSHAPEELVPGAAFDTLDLRVFSRPGSDWVGDGHGFPLNSVIYEIDTDPMILSFNTAVLVPTSIVVSNISSGSILNLDVDYVIDWTTNEITIINNVLMGQSVQIDVYGLGGGNQLFQEVIPGNEVGNQLIVDVSYNEIQEFAIFVNGEVTTQYTYSELYTTPGVFTSYVAQGSNGTTLRVISTEGIVAGSLIVGVGFAGQIVDIVFDETTLIISAPPSATPSQIEFRLPTGKTVIDFVDTYDSADSLSVTAIGPTVLDESTTVNYSWSTAVVQTIVSPGNGVLEFALDNSVEYTNPDNLIVSVNGQRARTSAGAEWYADGSTAYLLPTRLGFSQGIIADADVRVYVNDIPQTRNVDYVVEPYTPGDDRAIEFLNPPEIGSRILICVITGSQCYVYVAGGFLNFVPGSGIEPTEGSVIEVITWNDTRQQNLLTKVYVGPTTQGVTLEEPYDSTDYDAGPYDYQAGVILTVNDLFLDRPVSNANRLYVTLNGRRLFPTRDFTLDPSGTELLLNGTILKPNDVVMITIYSQSVVPPEMAFRVFQDMRGLQTTYRITDITTTTLSEALTAEADVIHVLDAGALEQPALNYNQWGVLTIDGERIMYRERDLINNTVSSLIRGTAGTAATSHEAGSFVYNMSRSNMLPTQYQNYVVTNLTNDTDIDPVLGDGVNKIFVSQDIDAGAADSSFNDESIEVYLGGIRQSSGYTITSLAPEVTVEFDVAPLAGVQVTILVRRGTWWYNIATSAERAQSLQETANPAARFLRDQ